MMVPLLQGPLLRLLPAGRPRLLVPEVIQSSAMDCGPAVLKALLGGFGIDTNYGRLREACQTDVDGTSLDTLEKLANLLGLEADQIMLPADHLFAEQARALPAIVAVRRPSGAPHFVVVWKRVGRYVQVMDPGSGRYWTTRDRLTRDLFLHHHVVQAVAWRQWAGTAEFTDVLLERLAELGAGEAVRQQLLSDALADARWGRLASLDASARLVADLMEAGAVPRGGRALGLLGAIRPRSIPHRYWSVRPREGLASVPAQPLETLEGEGEPDSEELVLRGAVLVAVRGRRPNRVASSHPAHSAHSSGTRGSLRLSAETLASLAQPEARPEHRLLGLLKEDGLLDPTLLVAGLFVSAAGLVAEALILRGLLDVGLRLPVASQRLGVMAVVLFFASALLLTDLSLACGLRRLGRRLEIRLRLAFLEKLPRLGDRYFRSRLRSDMAQRSHTLHRVRNLTSLGGRMVRDLFELVLLVVAIAWLDPRSAPLAVVAASLVVAVPLAAQRRLVERDLEVRSHSATLARGYFDALLGLVAIRAHSAERNVTRQHEMRLNRWARSALGLQRGLVALQGLQLFVGFGFSAWLLVAHLGRQGVTGTTLLLAYWALRLPVLGGDIVHLAGRYPMMRNITARLMEPLGAPDEEGSDGQESCRAASTTKDQSPGPAHIRFEGFKVASGGHTILESIDLEVPAGSHTAIVGPSGAGKSTLVASLLGFHPAAAGRLLVDGELLRGSRLRELRRHTAWVDPEVQLFNRSLYDNLTYGLANPPGDLSRVLHQADLLPLLETLRSGMATWLGEGGGLLSGGEGQRVRLGRALLHSDARLVLLDEALCGLDRAARIELLARCREHWAGTTLLCVTHELWQTRTFDQVVVVEKGRITEVGEPSGLLEIEGSRYRRLFEAEEESLRLVWESPVWRRLHLENGRLREIV